MPTQVTTILYSINELEDVARENAINEVLSVSNFPWADEWFDSLRAFAKQIGATLRDAEIGPLTFARLDTTEGALTGQDLLDHLKDTGIAQAASDANCNFTGYTGDESLLDPVREFLNNPDKEKQLIELIEDCCQSWARDAQADWEHHSSSEYAVEFAQMNDMTFDENGRISR